MKIGFGTTVLEKGLSQGHMDGIGVYSKNLLEQFKLKEKERVENIIALSFGKSGNSGKGKKIIPESINIDLPYPLLSAKSIIGGKAFTECKEAEENMDIFFAPDHYIPRLNNTPIIATIHDAYPIIYPKLVSRRLRGFKNFAFKKAAHWADHIVTISQHSKGDISKFFNISESNISVIPNGVNERFFRKVPEEEKIPVLKKYGLESGYFIFIGTIQPRKNIGYLIEAYLSLPEKIKKEHGLLIIGQYGWGEESLKKRLENLRQDDNIKWIESVSENELYALLQSAIAMVYPTLYEGFGLPVLEGFASEIPVIASNTTSIPEVAADAALYIDPTNIADISKKMEMIASDSDMRWEMITRGRKRTELYSWKNSADSYIKLFEKYI